MGKFDKIKGKLTERSEHRKYVDHVKATYDPSDRHCSGPLGCGSSNTYFGMAELNTGKLSRATMGLMGMGTCLICRDCGLEDPNKRK